MGIFIIVRYSMGEFKTRTIIPHSNISSIYLNENLHKIVINLKHKFEENYGTRESYTFRLGEIESKETFNLLFEKFNKNQYFGELYLKDN